VRNRAGRLGKLRTHIRPIPASARCAADSAYAWRANRNNITQEAPIGLAHVVKISEDFIKDEPFVFYLGDNVIVGGIKKILEEFK
jgi:dTDP-glucose pyrophosphorylase